MKQQCSADRQFQIAILGGFMSLANFVSDDDAEICAIRCPNNSAGRPEYSETEDHVHQIQNFVRFCETLAKHPAIRKIHLITSYDGDAPSADSLEKFEELKQSLLELDVVLGVDFDRNLHDREIRVNNGWVIKIGRGLDFYQKPGGWYEVGVNDLVLRKCLETKVDIYKVPTQ